jgi:hypothetical protein
MTPVRAGVAAAVLARGLTLQPGTGQVLPTAAQILSPAAQGEPATGIWQVTGSPAEVLDAPWTFDLTQTGTKLIGTVRQGGVLKGPAGIRDGTVQGNVISFKVESPSGARVITFTGTIAGDSIDLRRSIEDPVREPNAPGVFDMFGPIRVTAHRADPVAAAMALGTPLPGSALHLVEDVLTQYEAGDFDVAIGSLPPELGEVAALMVAEAPSWIAAGDATGSIRRRLVVASVALEAVRRALASSPLVPTLGAAAERLIAWAHELLPSTSPPERAWYLASIALAERTSDHTFLIGVSRRRKGTPGEGAERAVAAERARLGAPVGYLPAVQSLLPDEPRVRLASVVADDLTLDELGWLSAPQDLTASRMKPFSGFYETLPSRRNMGTRRPHHSGLEGGRQQ